MRAALLLRARTGRASSPRSAHSSPTRAATSSRPTSTPTPPRGCSSNASSSTSNVARRPSPRVRADCRALRHGLAGARPRDTGAYRGARVAPGSLPRRSPRAQSTRRAAGRHRARRVEPRDARRARGALRARRSTTCPSARTAPRRSANSRRSLDAAAPDVVVLARYMRVLPAMARRAVAQPDDQHPPLVPAVVRGRAPVPASARTGRQGDRCDRPLRDARTRRGSDHRPAGTAGLPPRRSRRASNGEAATSKPSCSPKRCDFIWSTA